MTFHIFLIKNDGKSIFLVFDILLTSKHIGMLDELKRDASRKMRKKRHRNELVKHWKISIVVPDEDWQLGVV